MIGINWAVCEGYVPPKKGEKKEENEEEEEEGGDGGGKTCADEELARGSFEIKVNMYSNKIFAGKVGPFYMKFASENMEGEEFLLNPAKFNPG